MKIISTMLICFCGICANAQTTGAPVGRDISLSIGGGLTSPGNSFKSSANLGNLTNFNVGLYASLFGSGSVAGIAGGAVAGRSFGINVSGEYLSGNKAYDLHAYTPFNVTGQTGAPTLAAKGSGSPKQQGFKFEAGAQANFAFGKVTLSPILNAAYLSFKQNAFSVTQTSSANGRTSDFNLYSQEETKTNGFALVPKLRVGYAIGKFGFYAEGNYTAGPTVTNQTSMFKPQGEAQKDGSYSIDQMMSGSNSAQARSNKFSSVGVNVGISFYLAKKGYDYYKAHSDMGSARLIKADAGVNSSPAEAGKIREKYLNNLFRTENGIAILKPELFKEVRSESDWKGRKVAITKGGKSYVFLGDQDELVRVITTPTNRVKECTDCTTRTCNGVVYDCTCVNGFCMCVLCVEITKLTPAAERVVTPTGTEGQPTIQNKGINEAGMPAPAPTKGKGKKNKS
jgi:hypothetical protein